MNLSPLLKRIPFIEKLKNYEVYLVGGPIRDFLLGIEPQDFDIVIRGSGINFAKKLNSIIGGRMVVLSEKDDEVRLVISPKLWFDISGMKGETIYEDLRRRDFTINSMAVPLYGEPVLIDVVGGLTDIKKRLIRTISSENLEEDPLRLLRAFRFASTLDFSIEEVTFKFIKDRAHLIKGVAKERIKAELFYLLKGKRVAKNLKDMAQSSLLEAIFPEISPLRETSQFFVKEVNLLKHSLKTVEELENIIKNIPPPLERFKKFFVDFFDDPDKRALMFLGALFHDVGKPETLTRDEEGRTHFYGHEKIGASIVENIAERLRFSKKEREFFKSIVRNHMHPHFLSNNPPTTRAIYRYVKKTGELAFPLLILAYADASATPPMGGLEGHLILAEKLNEYLLKEEKKPKERLVTGNDLIAKGLKPGPVFREILNEIEELEAEGKIKTRSDALKILDEIIEKRGLLKG
jgi:poly(A) polymerase